MSTDPGQALTALLDEPTSAGDLQPMPIGTVPLGRVDGRPVSVVVPPADAAARATSVAAALEVAARRRSPLIVVDLHQHAAGTAAGAGSAPLPLAVRPDPWVPIVAIGNDPWAVAGADLAVLIGTDGPRARRAATAEAAAELARRFLANLGPNPAPSAGPALGNALTELVPFETGAAYDIDAVLDAIVDAPGVLALEDDVDRGIRLGLARLGGRPVGVVASDPAIDGGRLGRAACRGLVRLVELCTAARLPLLSLVDSAGLRAAPTGDEPTGDELVRALRAMWAAPVLKVVVVLGRAHGPAAALLGAVGVRADVVAAWPRARFAGPDPDAPPAGTGPAFAAAPTDAASVWQAARDGALLDVIAPAETRGRLLEVLDVYRGAERFDRG